MTLRTQYSLRQALPVALFGMPQYVLEQALVRLLPKEDVELVGFSSGTFQLFLLPILGVFTFLRAYERFEAEFGPPVREWQIVWLRWIPVFLTAILAVSLIRPSGVAPTEYHVARLFVLHAGLLLGLTQFKWIYFDWLEKLGQGGGNGGDPTASLAPFKKEVIPRERSAHNACRVWF